MLLYAVIVAAIWFLWRALVHAPYAAWATVFGFLGLRWLLQFAWVGNAIALILSVLVIMVAVAIGARRGFYQPERAMLGLPVIGWVYRHWFLAETYYRVDTMLMFQSAVHSAMMETIDGLTEQKGARRLSEDERKPVFYRFM